MRGERMYIPELLEALKRSDGFKLQKTKPPVSVIYGSAAVRPIFNILIEKFEDDVIRVNGTVTILVEGFDRDFLSSKEHRPPLSSHLGNFPSISNVSYFNTKKFVDFDVYVAELVALSATLPSSIEELCETLSREMVGNHELKYFRGREADFAALRQWLSSRSGSG